jgi:phosphate starvation-inducible protein PhoH
MFFSKSDVVRHKLVKDIVNAYEKYEENQINIVNEINKINKKQLVVL